MKKLFIPIAVPLITISSSFGQRALEVTYPNGGESWQVGSAPTTT